MTENVEDRWRALLARGEPESREVDAGSPLRMIVGVSPVGRPYFAVVVSERPGVPDVTNAIEVTRRQRASDGRWTLTLELQVLALTDPFVSLVSELAAKSAEAPSEADALTVFLQTLAEWQELLTAQAGRLSEAALRGLVAELWFGFESEVHGHGLDEVTRAWSGPLGGSQDFQFPSPGLRYEVKSLRPGRTNIEISSEGQLDGKDIRLAVVTVEQLASYADGVTLPDLVASIRTRIQDGADRAEFNRRFARLLVDLDDDWYSEQTFVVRRLHMYDVNDSFPALRRSTLPDAIDRTSYRIDVQRLPQFIILETDYTHRGSQVDG
ncbi:MAG TPA: PD-(D/E)XK motif protein [Acidothermaceae bacterium]